MRLIDLKDNETATITKIKGQKTFIKRMSEMGFIEGQKIKVVRHAPLQDPIEYEVMGYKVSIRRHEASLIEISIDNHRQEINSLQENHYFENKNTSHTSQKTINVALIGNPNSGKTTLFNQLTGLVEHVGNYSGVTVDIKHGSTNFEGYHINFYDLPGIYSLTSYSPEEKIVLEHIINEVPDIILNVVDSGNLERNLYLTAQLLDANLKMVTALNIYDEFLKTKAELDYQMLGGMLGVPFVPTIGSKKIGLTNLLKAIVKHHEAKTFRTIKIRYDKPIEKLINLLEDELTIENTGQNLTAIISPRFIAIRLIEQSPFILSLIKDFDNYFELQKIINSNLSKIKSHFTTDIDTLIVNSRYGFIKGALKETLLKGSEELNPKSNLIDYFLTHKYLGFPIFILFLWIMFQGTFSLGYYPMKWLEWLFDWLKIGFDSHFPAGTLHDLISNGIITGIGSVIIFLPNIILLFFFISLMEDTGYMARAAFIMDKLMHKIGLHGKSFIPLIMGFGCNVPAIMATRTIESRNDRILTILINPFMSCSARLPIYILITGALFPDNAGNVIFALYILGIITAILIAILFKKLFFNKDEVPFVMELPPYRIPTSKSIIRHMWHKSAQYLQKMGNIILFASIIIWALGYFPRQDKKTSENQAVSTITHSETTTQTNQLYHSYIGQIGRSIQPVFEPLGFDWRMTVSILTGVTAKEVIVSTMGVLYNNPQQPQNLQTIIREGKDSSGKPLFDKITALSFLIFILLYFPCVATIAAVKKETGKWSWALFMIFYTTSIAWIFSFAFYHIAHIIL